MPHTKLCPRKCHRGVGIPESTKICRSVSAQKSIAAIQSGDRYTGCKFVYAKSARQGDAKDEHIQGGTVVQGTGRCRRDRGFHQVSRTASGTVVDVELA